MCMNTPYCAAHVQFQSPTNHAPAVFFLHVEAETTLCSLTSVDLKMTCLRNSPGATSRYFIFLGVIFFLMKFQAHISIVYRCMWLIYNWSTPRCTVWPRRVPCPVSTCTSGMGNRSSHLLQVVYPPRGYTM
jgi:hypothetical protein